MKTLATRIPDELLVAFKSLCSSHHRSIQDAISSLITLSVRKNIIPPPELLPPPRKITGKDSE